MQQSLSTLISQYRLQLILLVSLINGLAYMFLVPPWQHYDEPGHFEYAWLVANLDHWPHAGEYDQQMRREVAASMIEHDFYRGMNYLPNLLEVNKPVEIGISQVGDLPIYYFLASIPLRIMKYTDITWQLYCVRFVSVLLFVFTIWLALKTSNLIFGDDHPLAWMAALYLSFLPALVDLMSAVNNDVSAITFFTLFGYAGVRLLKKGINLFNLGLLLIAMGLCIFSKSTAWLAIPIGGLTLFIALYRKKYIWIYIGLASIFFLLLLYFFFNWQQPAPQFFYATSDTIVPRSLTIDDAPHGSNVFLQSGQRYSGQGFYHVFEPSTLQSLSGTPISIGFWAWADQPTKLRTPVLVINRQTIQLSNENLALDVKPKFYIFSVILPENISRGWLQTFATTDMNNRIFWDGLFLVPGDLSKYSTEPNLIGNTGKEVDWNGKVFSNLIRNGSGELTWPVISPTLSNHLGRNFNFSSTYLWSVFDPRANGWYFRASLIHLFRSFWAVFGWSHIFLVGEKPYRFLFVISLLSMVGLALLLGKKKGIIDRKVLLIFLSMVGLQLAVVMLRGAGSWFTSTLIPAARYFFPVILPVTILLVMGWYSLFKRIFDIIRVPVKIQTLVYVLCLVMLELWALYSIYQFYK